MKTSTVLASMLAGAAACAIATAPALASPGIHLSTVNNKAVSHFKTNMSLNRPHNTGSFTTTVVISGSVSSHFSGLLYAYTWYTRNSAGQCVQPKKQKQKYTKPSKKVGKVAAGSTTATNPCGTGDFTYLGPVFTAKGAGNGSFTGKLTAKKFYGSNLLLNEDVTLTVS